MSSDSSTPVADSRSLFFWNLSLFFQLFGVAAGTFLPLYWLSLDFSKSSVAQMDSLGFLLSVIGPLLPAFYLRRVSYKLFVSLSFIFSGLFSFLFFLSGQFYVQLSSFVLVLLGMGISATIVPLSVVIMLSSASFGREYGGYRRTGSYGFLLGLIVSGYSSDILGARMYPFFAGIGFIGAGLSFLMVHVDSENRIFKRVFSLRRILVSSDLLLFGLSQLVVWASLAICFRYLPLRMVQMGSSSLLISVVVSLYGLLAIISLKWIGDLSDSVSIRLLWGTLPLALFLRIISLYLPEENYFWFIPLQILHIPTWVLNDILTVRYLSEKRDTIGALNVSVLTQLGMIFGMAIGSFLMYLALLVWELRDSFMILSVFPLLFYPVFVMKWASR